MADKYKGWVVENAHKPAFRTVYQGRLGCSDMHRLSKATLLEIALNFDRRHHPLSLSDPDIKNKINAAQLAEVQQQVEIAKLKKKGIKTDAGGTGQNDKEAAAGSEQVQKTETTTAWPGKGKARGQDGEATSDNSAAADLGQDGHVRMAGDEDAAEAAPPVDLTAEAVPSPVDDKRKRKRTDTVSSFDTERAGNVRPQTSLIVKLKLRGSARVGTRGMQTTTQVSKTECDMITALANDYAQGLGLHQGQNQVAEDTRPVKARRLVDKPGSRLQHGLAPPLALAKPLESGKKDSGDAVARGMGDVFGSADPANALEQRSSRRQPQRMKKKKASVPVGDTSEETKEASEGDPKDTVAGQDVSEKLDSDAGSLAEEDDPTWPKDENGKPKIFGSDGTIVCYLYEETEEEEKLFPYNWLNGPERMRRNERQARRRRAQAEKEAAARGEEYVPKPKKEPYDWTKHM
ncbi:hypothetical protein J4E83_004371 [Alternaria metachromatica]|uniref:uncharacterized protein n=1 Tax=Alternaria metachromatica TaxID=283354 RepID=UPI0020C4A9B3|nr:uncharacterized protein J4E83_004371 [Alternaria metachromatica]KAI4624695.1 hypothetical protein J4E83_004371 [Alternaria metachromatica]